MVIRDFNIGIRKLADAANIVLPTKKGYRPELVVGFFNMISKIFFKSIK